MSDERRMAWERNDGVEEGDLTETFLRTAELVHRAEDSLDMTKKIVATGIVSADEKVVTFTFDALDAPVLSLALNLVGFHSKELREQAESLLRRMVEAEGPLTKDEEFETRLAEARGQVFRAEMQEAIESLGLENFDGLEEFGITASKADDA